jgi:hypothetical protein
MCKHCNEQQVIEADKRIDVCLFDLRSLLEQGYTTVKWVNRESACVKCIDLNNREWTLEEFINDTQYEAPIFWKAHPQCLCFVLVSHPNGSVVNVDYTGVI